MSFRGGTGKSNLEPPTWAAAPRALGGRRVGIVDNRHSIPRHPRPCSASRRGAHHALLNDYLWGRLRHRRGGVRRDRQPRDANHPAAGRGMFLIPLELPGGRVARVLSEGYDVARLNDGFRELRTRSASTTCSRHAPPA
jgi:hypothetical protein